MATNNQPGDPATEETETVDQDNQDTDQTDPSETPGESSAQDHTEDDASGDSEGTDQTDKKDPAKAALLADLHKARTDSKAYRARVTELETQLAELAPVKETLDAVQTRANRLEAVLQAVGGDLGRAMDSKSFTTALFETDRDVTEILREWYAANPTATSVALGAGPAAPANTKPDMNDLLRKALK